MIIRYLPIAVDDLDRIWDFNKQERGEATAERIISRILQVNRYLEEFPRLGRPGLIADTRELSIKGLPYKTIYRIEGDVVLVLNIIHTSRNWP